MRVKVYIIDINRGIRFATYRGKIYEGTHLLLLIQAVDTKALRITLRVE
jgi:hypothetical protein